MKKRIFTALAVLVSLIVLCAAALFIINSIVINASEQYITDIENIDTLDTADCVLVLGALVYDDTHISPILADRMQTAIAIYKAGKADKLLLSGDHGQKEYDEVNAMMEYAVSCGVPKEDIFLDHAGFSTYESIYRARDVFLVRNVIIVTQEFHLSRAIYIAQALSLNARGVKSDLRRYAAESYNNIRESIARVKDFLYVHIFLPEPKYLGDSIPIFGKSNLTFDKN